MHPRTPLTLLGIFTMALVSAPLTTRGQPATVSLDTAVSRALERSPALLASRLSAEGADARTRQSETAWLPRIDFTASYRFSGPVPELTLDTGITPPGASAPLVVKRTVGTEHNASASVSVGWRAYDFGARDIRTEAAEAAARAARTEGDARAVEVAYAVRASYLAALFFGEVTDVTDRSLATAREELHDREAERKAGLGNAVASAGVEARIAELEARRVEAAQSRERALDTLRILLGLPAEAEIALTTTLAPTETAAPEAAPGQSPTLERLQLLARAALLQHDSIGRTYWPTLDVFGQFSYQYPKTLFETEDAGIAYAAGVMLSWSLFDGDLRSRQRDELSAKAAELNALEAAATEEQARGIADARAKRTTAEASAEAANRRAEAAQVYMTAAKGSLAAGTGTELDVRKAEEAIDGARLALSKARFDAALARADLLRAEGQTGMKEVRP